MGKTTLTICGNGDFNYLWGKEGILTDDDIQIMDKNIHTPNWDENTFLLANFTQDLSASCFNQSENLTGYRIQKHNDTTKAFEMVVDMGLDANHKVIEDYNIRNEETYEYWIFPIFNTNNNIKYGNPIVSNKITPKWECLSIVGLKETEEENYYIVDQENIWNFYLNISGGTLTPQFNKVYHEGFGQFSKVVGGERNYLKGQYSCLIGNVDCKGNYAHDNVYILERWREFCKNNTLKLLKTPKGYVLPVDIEDTSYSIDESLLDMPSTITFNFRQMLDSNKIAVYGLEVI